MRHGKLGEIKCTGWKEVGGREVRAICRNRLNTYFVTLVPEIIKSSTKDSEELIERAIK